LARRDFAASETALAPVLPPNVPPGFALAGSDTCRKCHQNDWHSWRQSAHAAAWHSLERKDAQADPDCQRCHATGYGMPGGFVSAGRSHALVGVGCESCHGPSAAHVADPTVHTPHFREARAGCQSCHDRENSPKFALDSYWNKIRHGSSRGVPASGASSAGPGKEKP
jgi:hypothetical protein